MYVIYIGFIYICKYIYTYVLYIYIYILYIYIMAAKCQIFQFLLLFSFQSHRQFQIFRLTVREGIFDDHRGHQIQHHKDGHRDEENEESWLNIHKMMVIYYVYLCFMMSLA